MMRGIRSWAIAILFLAHLVSVANAQRCTVPLVGFGPVDPADGFPQYYLDANNLGLAQCLDFVFPEQLPGRILLSARHRQHDRT
ncbi:MAG: hypothetical protein E6J77_22175 [Deltaproteobacteria bacterium]|nr:MAG: hypothetical protein E6J77_22175 [Deltaproteobacteria bacterium]